MIPNKYDDRGFDSGKLLIWYSVEVRSSEMNYSEKSVSLVLNRDRFCSVEDNISFERTVQSVGAIA